MQINVTMLLLNLLGKYTIDYRVRQTILHKNLEKWSWSKG